ncbi:MAG: hypothetical protein WC779_08055 [Candidatus Omnitrophota bacterium]|jgi:hypothetical protein
MLIKQKSLIVALVSSFVIAMVLVLTLVAYLIYIELRGEEFKRSYQDLLSKVNSKVYSKNLETVKLDALIEPSGALKGTPVIDGILKNKGSRNITALLLKVKFLDKDGAAIYEVTFHPQEPSLGDQASPQVVIPYLSGPARIILRSGESLAFKRILSNCPKEIIQSLQDKPPASKAWGRWTGKLVSEVLSIDF